MGCLLALLGAFAPRLLFLIIWIARPAYVDAVFDTFILPLLGLIFLPFTTLLWVLLDAPPGGIEGFDIFWIVLAVLMDLSHYAGCVRAAWAVPRADRDGLTIPLGSDHPGESGRASWVPAVAGTQSYATFERTRRSCRARFRRSIAHHRRPIGNVAHRSARTSALPPRSRPPTWSVTRSPITCLPIVRPLAVQLNVR